MTATRWVYRLHPLVFNWSALSQVLSKWECSRCFDTFEPINCCYWQYTTWNAYQLFIKIIIYDCTWWSLFEIFQHLFTISKEFSPMVHLDCSDWMAHVPGASAMGLTAISWQGEISLFLGWLHSPQDPKATASANHSQQLLQHVYKMP